ncbi:tetratricopeptide repeat-containing sensor histidine kinase [Maribacter sp. 2-571]|uniref:tetratricopeptide repeat-containing sensor histidine kinase n=1 Tax=Maribacter sp. 2-571 TaxID=3417569 RepID=UPI003D3325EF
MQRVRVKATLFLTLLLSIVSGALRGQKNDTPIMQVEKALATSKQYALTDRDSAMHYALQAEKRNLSLNDHRLKIAIKNQKAIIHIYKGAFDEAEKLLRQNIAETEIDGAALATAYQNLGTVFNYGQRFEQAVEYYLKALDLGEKNKDTSSLGKIYSNLGGIHARLGNTDKASRFLNSALLFLKDEEPQKMQVVTNLAGVAFNNGQLDEAISLTLEAEQLAVNNKIPIFLGTIYSNLCNFYLEKKEFDTSIAYGEKGLENKKRFGKNTDVVVNNIAYAYLQQGRPDAAIAYLETIPKNAQADVRVLAYNNLREAYELQNKPTTALRYANLYASLKDSIVNASQAKQVAELSEKYESEKKEQQIEVLRTKDALNNSKIKTQRAYFLTTAILGLLLLISVFFWYREQRTKQSLKTAQIRHRLLQTQLNPHFLFHALNSIQSFIFKGKKEESVGYLGSFSKLMRSILESSDQDFITIEEDIKALRAYLELQKLNTNDAWGFEIDVADSVKDEMLLIPPMFTQPYVENAVLHGLKGTADGMVTVRYGLKQNRLEIEVSDNGKGPRPEQKNANQLHRSMSTKILDNRIENLKKTHRFHCKVKTTYADNGTKVYLSFPMKYDI